MRTLAFLFALAAFDLIAAPPGFHLDYATYLGGSLDEGSSGIAVDSSGSAYLVGTTSSPDFPLTSTAFGVPSKDHRCAFVTKLNAAGTRIVWSICLADAAGVAGIAVGPDGSVYVLTNTADGSFVSKLSPDADKIVYAKALGATAAGMAVDAQGNVYVTGTTGPGLVTTEGAFQRQPHPGMCDGGVGIPSYQCPDAFVMKFRPDGQVAYATYVGGSGPDQARAVAVDSQGNAWITGDSESADFPTTPGAWEPAFQGEVDLGPVRFGDAFVAKLNPTGSSLLYATYLGGKAPDVGSAIAVDAAGAAYVTGSTQSADFPTTQGALQRTYGGGNRIPALAGDAFVAKFSASGAVAYATFLGGSQAESGSAIAVDKQGDAYVNVNPNTSTLNPNTVSILNPSGSAIVNSAPVNGWFAIDGEGSLYFTAITLGYMFFPTAGAFQTTFGGTNDATVVKIDFGGASSAWVANIVNAAGLRSGTPSFYPVFDVAPGEIITIFGSGFASNTRVLFDGIAAPIIYAGNDQINAVVPFAVLGPATAVTLQGSGQALGPGMMHVFDAVPALFTLDGSGKGQAAILNQDGSINSPSNPAQRGSVISVFMTGAGRMTPAQPDGSLGPLGLPFPVPVLGVAASVGQVLYAGAAPGLVAGAVQVNVRISQDVAPGDHVPIVIYVGNYASGFTGDTTVAIR